MNVHKISERGSLDNLLKIKRRSLFERLIDNGMSLQEIADATERRSNSWIPLIATGPG